MLDNVDDPDEEDGKLDEFSFCFLFNILKFEFLIADDDEVFSVLLELIKLDDK